MSRKKQEVHLIQGDALGRKTLQGCWLESGRKYPAICSQLMHIPLVDHKKCLQRPSNPQALSFGFSSTRLLASPRNKVSTMNARVSWPQGTEKLGLFVPDYALYRFFFSFFWPTKLTGTCSATWEKYCLICPLLTENKQSKLTGFKTDQIHQVLLISKKRKNRTHQPKRSLVFLLVRMRQSATCYAMKLLFSFVFDLVIITS